MKNWFPKNLNSAGRVARSIIAILFMILFFWKKNYIYLIISLFIFFEVYMSWCIVFHLLGINQCKIKKRK